MTIRNFKRWDIAVSYAVEGEPVRSIAERAGVSIDRPMVLAIDAGMLDTPRSKIGAREAADVEAAKERARRRGALERLWARKPHLLDGARSSKERRRLALDELWERKPHLLDSEREQ